MGKILKLHHAAYRCRDSEQTRAFYEDFLGLPLVDTLEIGTTRTGRDTAALHTFFALADGSCVAFFEEPNAPFEFKTQRDFDLHLALQVDQQTLHSMLDKGRAAGIDTRGPTDHGSIISIYFRDPNGYVVELTAPVESSERAVDAADARRKLERWQQTKPATRPA